MKTSHLDLTVGFLEMTSAIPENDLVSRLVFKNFLFLLFVDDIVIKSSYITLIFICSLAFFITLVCTLITFQNTAFTDWDRMKDEASAIAGDIKQVLIF